MINPSGGIQSTERDQQQFVIDIRERQVREISRLTLKMDSRIMLGLKSVEQSYPDDDILAVTERIIKFLRVVY